MNSYAFKTLSIYGLFIFSGESNIMFNLAQTSVSNLFYNESLKRIKK